MNTARFCQFRDIWGNKWSFCSEEKKIGTTISSRIFFSCLMKSIQEHYAYCKYCKQDVSIQHGGREQGTFFFKHESRFNIIEPFCYVVVVSHSIIGSVVTCILFYYIYGFIQYYKTIPFVFCNKSSYCTAGFHEKLVSDPIWYLLYLANKNMFKLKFSVYKFILLIQRVQIYICILLAFVKLMTLSVCACVTSLQRTWKMFG
jgi:hypothetical protein